MQEAKKYYGGKNTKPKGFGAPELGPINQEAERIIRGMKRQSGSRFKKLYGKRDKDVMTLTANKLAIFVRASEVVSNNLSVSNFSISLTNSFLLGNFCFFSCSDIFYLP